MVDNFKQIKDLLSFENDDDFYHAQIIKRKKENFELGSNSYVIKTYYITSINELELIKDEIINLCKFHNARAYINVDKRSFEKLAYQTLKHITDQIMNKNFRSINKSYDTVCGRYSHEKDKNIIIDIDYKDIVFGNDKILYIYINEMISFVQKLIQETGRDDTVHELSSKNGMHLICKKFNISKFKKRYPKIEAYKNVSTNLYIP